MPEAAPGLLPPSKPLLSADQEVVSQDTLRHMTMPAEPGPNHILVDAQVACAILNAIGLHLRR